MEPVVKMKPFILGILLMHGASGFDADIMFVEGDPVTLRTNVKTNQQDRIRWYFNNTRIAQITGGQSKICTDDQCDERFRDRLKLDHQTGSLTITNTRTTDSGLYHQETIISGNISEKIFSVTITGRPGSEAAQMKRNMMKGASDIFDNGASAVETDSVSVFVMEEDAVMLYTNFEINQTDSMIWFSGDNRIAIINGYQIKICIDDWCKERFRDRLKVNNMTGSLTIMNTRTTDTGLYKLEIISSNTEKIFKVTVLGVSVAERDEMKRKSVKEGESVTLESGEINKTNYSMAWYFNDTIIQSKICTDDQCVADERFRGRLKLDHRTGSLSITNTRTTDSGLYTLQISSSRFSIIRSFTVTVTDVSDSGSSSVAVVVVLLLLLLLVAAAVFCKRKAIMGWIRRQRGDQINVAEKPSLNSVLL